MNVYSPDCWEVIEITSPEFGKIRKVMAGWYGGYTGSDSWKINSGIKSYKIVGDFIEFLGDSGSVYRCHKNCRRMSGYMMTVYAGFTEQLKEIPGCSIEIIREGYENQ